MFFGRVLDGGWFGHVEILVDLTWNGENFCAELLFDLVHGESIFVGDQTDRNAQMTEATWSTNTMATNGRKQRQINSLGTHIDFNLQIGFAEPRKVEVDDHVHGLNVDTTCEQIRADKIATETGTEIVEHSVAMLLTHLGVNIITIVT